jgi:hypothetical protein
MSPMATRKNRAAVELAKLRMKRMTAEERSEVARLGGLAGGSARAKALDPERRAEIAKKAAALRWGRRAKAKK